MSYADSETHGIARAVALQRLQARRSDDAAVALSMVAAADFADTVPLWFRSEAFAEDVVDTAGAAPGEAARVGGRWQQRIDTQVMAAGAAVLRLTLQALQLQRRT